MSSSEVKNIDRGPSDSSEPLLSELGGYGIIEQYVDPPTAIALAPGGRRVVLKMLEEDLIVRGQLHPSVRDRLARVREIAHLGVANLYGAERDAGRAFLIWELVDGVPLQAWCETADLSPRHLLALGRDLVLAVEALHARGVVHGAIHGRNVIVCPNGRLKLTHISPYLYTDVSVDTTAVVEVLKDAVARTGHTESPLAPILAEFAATPHGVELRLRTLGSRIAALLEAKQVDPPPAAEMLADGRRRRQSFLGGIGVAFLGLIMAYGIHRTLNVFSSAAPVPPEASPVAMSP